MDDLQFDKADYAATGDAPTVCEACQNPLIGEYFHINERPFCASCKSGIQQALGGTPGIGGFVIGLTYVAIVSTYVPDVIQGLREAGTKPPAASAPVEQTAGPGATPAATTTPAPAATASPDDNTPFTFVGALIGLVVFFVLILVLPFLGGFSNILGIVIIGIGLYEAWKINKRVPLAITGPFAVPPPGLAAPPAIPAIPAP